VPPPPVAPPPPIIRQPVLQRVWICGACRGVLRAGAAPPRTCPHCNALITNGVGPEPVQQGQRATALEQKTQDRQADAERADRDEVAARRAFFRTFFLCAGAIVFIAVAIVAGVIIYCCTRPPANSKRRRTVPDDGFLVDEPVSVARRPSGP
jgi:hypothetical protein